VPGFLPDLPDVRRELAQYCSSARRCDDTFAAVMQVLDDEGLAENTLVVFLSDNGMSQPFAKTNAYFNSTRTPFIVRHPGVTKAGSKDDAHFVSAIDFMPTVLDACGFEPPAGVDGRSFLPLLRDGTQEGRERVFTQIYETSRHFRYPMFSVQDADYIMLYNPWSDGTRVFRNEAQGGLAAKAMNKAARTDPRIRERVNFHLHRVPLELYDVKKDTDALVNLAGDPKYAEVVTRMSAQLKGWMQKYDPAPASAFNAFPSEKERATYMQAQEELPRTRAKNNKGKRAKANAK
jgi:N-sulfoglucosamine sulfohydrolase